LAGKTASRVIAERFMAGFPPTRVQRAKADDHLGQNRLNISTEDDGEVSCESGNARHN